MLFGYLIKYLMLNTFQIVSENELLMFIKSNDYKIFLNLKFD